MKIVFVNSFAVEIWHNKDILFYIQGRYCKNYSDYYKFESNVDNDLNLCVTHNSLQSFEKVSL